MDQRKKAMQTIQDAKRQFIENIDAMQGTQLATLVTVLMDDLRKELSQSKEAAAVSAALLQDALNDENMEEAQQYADATKLASMRVDTAERMLKKIDDARHKLAEDVQTYRLAKLGDAMAMTRAYKAERARA